MRTTREWIPKSAHWDIQSASHRLGFEFLESRRLLVSTSVAGPDRYLELVSDAVMKAQDFLAASPNSANYVESWLADDNAAEATSKSSVAKIELHLAESRIPPETPVILVEEMMEHLIEEIMPARRFVEVDFHFVSTTMADARLAQLAQPFKDPELLDRESELEHVGIGDRSSRASPAIARELFTNRDPVLTEGTTVIRRIPVEPDRAPTALVPTIESPADSTSQPVFVAAHHTTALPAGNARMVKQTDKPSPLLTQLRTDLRLVEESIVALLDELQEVKNDLVDWFGESEIPLWVKVTLGSAAVVVISRELRKRRHRHAQIDEGALDWIFMLSVEPTTPD